MNYFFNSIDDIKSFTNYDISHINYEDDDFEQKEKEEQYNIRSEFKYNKNAKNIFENSENCKFEKKTKTTNYEDNSIYKQQQNKNMENLIENEHKNNFIKNNFENDYDYYIFPIEKNNNQKIKLKELKNNLMSRKKRGRSSIGEGEHNKFSDDNIRRKCKHLVLKCLFNFINKKIIEIFNKIGYGIFRKQLLTINQKQKSNANIQFNKDFLNKSLEDIFSVDISTRYTSYPLSHNKQLINCLKNDENKDIAQYFRNLFKLTFIDCLKHFRGSQYFEELEGLESFDSIKEKYEDDKDYLKSLNYYIMNFEVIINNKRIRKKKIDDL